MNEADKIRVKNYEQQIDMLERENKALRKELFKYKLKEGESEVDESAQEILDKIRARRVKQKQDDFGRKIWGHFAGGGGLDD